MACLGRNQAAARLRRAHRPCADRGRQFRRRVTASAMLHTTRIVLWRSLAAFSLGLGAAGAFLPVLPTVPFLLVSAWAASRGWPRLEVWMLEHERFGPARSEGRRVGKA